MKHLLPVILLLCSCAKNPPETKSTEPVVNGEALSPLARTESHHETTLINAAGELVRHGGSLSSLLALRCWQREQNRPHVQEACLLAWSAGSEASTELEAALHAELRQGISRNLAIAVVRRAELLASFSEQELESILQALRDEPEWLRGIALRAWLGSNPAPETIAKHRLWSALNLADEPLDPRSLGLGYEVARGFGIALAYQIQASYCTPGASLEGSSRCLRFLSTLVDPVTGSGFPLYLKGFLPSRFDPAWLFFSRAFPERAILLDRFL